MKKTKVEILLSVLLLSFVFHMSYGQSTEKVKPGARYTGAYTKSNALKYTGKSNFVIEGVEITSNSSEGIGLYNCENVIIRNSKIVSPAHIGVYLWKCKNITIEDCVFENVQTGVRASTSTGVKFEHNDVLNVTGVLYNKEMGGMAHYMFVYGAGNSISYNVCENLPGQAEPEDIINLYDSNGTEGSPIVVNNNWIRGGGTSLSGGGINLGDWGGTYQIAEGNVLVNPGMYGIGITGGQHMMLKDNQVYSKRIPKVSGVGLIVYNYYEKNAGAFKNVNIVSNKINFTHRDGYIDTMWIPDDSKISGKSSNTYDSGVTESSLPTKILGMARDNAGSNNNNPGTEIEKPEVDTSIPNGGGGSDVPNVEDNNHGSDKDTDTDDNSGKDNEVSKPSNPSINQLPNVTIYLDRFNRICVNSRGRIYRSSNVIVSNTNGATLHSQSLTGFHTVLRSRFKKGTYFVTVKVGNRSQTKELTIK